MVEAHPGSRSLRTVDPLANPSFGEPTLAIGELYTPQTMERAPAQTSPGTRFIVLRTGTMTGLPARNRQQ